MKQLANLAFWAITALSMLMALGLAAWVVLVGFPFKRTYTTVKAGAGVAYRVRPIEELPTVQIAEVLDGWRCRLEDTNSVTDACSNMGFNPSVRRWVELFNAPLPEFSWLDLGQMKNAAYFGLTKMSFQHFSSDDTFYVSDDWSLAVVCDGDRVYVFQDQSNAVRFAFYSK